MGNRSSRTPTYNFEPVCPEDSLASRVTSQQLTLREHNCRLKLDQSRVNEEQIVGFPVGFQK